MKAIPLLRISAALLLSGTSILPAHAQGQASNITAFSRGCQTFITWTEAPGSTDGDAYRVYASPTPITENSLATARLLATVPHNSGAYHREADRSVPPHPDFVQTRFIITDRGPQLPVGTGLFVHTRSASDFGPLHYAVTFLHNGSENRSLSASNSLTDPLSASAGTRPVIAWESPDRHGRIYTQFMDCADWNPTFEGCAYNYILCVPPDYDGAAPLPLTLLLHGWGFRDAGYRFEDGTSTPYGWKTALMIIDDISCTWYHGFSQSDATMGPPNYLPPVTGPIRNYTEERILRGITDLVADPDPFARIDTRRIYVYGQSMGGTGALGLAMHFGWVFAAAYCSEPMTNWTTSGESGGTDWLPDAEMKWGPTAAALSIINMPPDQWTASCNGMNVWDWTNRPRIFDSLQTPDMAYIVVGHGTLDQVIGFESQARPLYGAMQRGRRAFAGFTAATDHTWLGFMGMPPNWVFDDFAFRIDEPIPAFSNASNSSTTPPVGVASYNQDLEWSSSWHDFDGPPKDTPTRFMMTLRSTVSNQRVDVTPRRTSHFSIPAGGCASWYNVSLESLDTLERGSVTSDRFGLLTVPGMLVSTTGNRLVLKAEGTTGVDAPDAPRIASMLSVAVHPDHLMLHRGDQPYSGPVTVNDILGRHVARLGVLNGIVIFHAPATGLYLFQTPAGDTARAMLPRR